MWGSRFSRLFVLVGLMQKWMLYNTEQHIPMMLNRLKLIVDIWSVIYAAITLADIFYTLHFYPQGTIEVGGGSVQSRGRDGVNGGRHASKRNRWWGRGCWGSYGGHYTMKVNWRRGVARASRITRKFPITNMPAHLTNEMTKHIIVEQRNGPSLSS